MMTASTRERYPPGTGTIPARRYYSRLYDAEIDSSDYDQKRSSLTRMLTEYSTHYILISIRCWCLISRYDTRTSAIEYYTRIGYSTYHGLSNKVAPCKVASSFSIFSTIKFVRHRRSHVLYYSIECIVYHLLVYVAIERYVGGHSAVTLHPIQYCTLHNGPLEKTHD